MALTNDNDNEIIKILKIVLLGSTKTGKTTFLMKLNDKKVDKDLEYIPTLGATYVAYNIEIEQENYKLEIWDTSGQEKFYRINKFILRDSDIIFFFIILMIVQALKQLKEW